VRAREEVIAFLVGEPACPDRDKLAGVEAAAIAAGMPAADARALRDALPILSKSTYRSKGRLLETAVINLVRTRVANGELAEVSHLLRENESLRLRAEGKLRVLPTRFEAIACRST
jgi:hypothetical protein